jgi:hypothetical protein
MRPTGPSNATPEYQSSDDVEVIRRSLQQYEAGESKELHAFFDEVRAMLFAMKAASVNKCKCKMTTDHRATSMLPQYARRCRRYLSHPSVP